MIDPLDLEPQIVGRSDLAEMYYQMYHN